jgi:hypothetical protein
MVINHLFAHSLRFTFFGYPALAQPSVAEPLYFSCWTVLDFEELLSTLYLVSYSFDYSSHFCPFPAQRIPSSRAYESSVSPSALTRALIVHLRRCILLHAPMTHIPQLARYASRERRTVVKIVLFITCTLFPLYLLLPPPALPFPPNTARSSPLPRPCSSVVYSNVFSVHGDVGLVLRHCAILGTD